MTRIHPLFLALACAFSFVLPAHAQDDDAANLRRDPQALAQRLLNADTTPVLPAMPTRYEVGETTEFWVGKNGSTTPTRITAELVAVMPPIYICVEQGIELQLGVAQRFAAALARLYSGLRARSTFSTTSSLPVGGG